MLHINVWCCEHISYKLRSNPFVMRCAKQRDWRLQWSCSVHAHLPIAITRWIIINLAWLRALPHSRLNLISLQIRSRACFPLTVIAIYTFSNSCPAANARVLNLTRKELAMQVPQAPVSFRSEHGGHGYMADTSRCSKRRFRQLIHRHHSNAN